MQITDRIFLLLILFCAVCINCVSAEMGNPNLVVYPNSPPTIERGSTATLSVSVQEISGLDYAYGVVVTPPTIASSSRCTISPISRTTSRISEYSSSTFYFTISAPADAFTGTYTGSVRVKYYETGAMGLGNYGPYYESGTFSVSVIKGTGDLSVTSNPSQATVYLDGNPRGKTPLKISDIKEGMHTVSMKKSGYKDYSTRISIVPGSLKMLDTTLAKSTADIKVSSTPGPANVFLDDTYKGISPVTITGVSPGKHNVKLVYEGYDDYLKEVSVTAGDVISVDASLVKSLPIPIPKIPGLSNEMVFGIIGVLLLIGIVIPVSLKRKPNRSKYTDNSVNSARRDQNTIDPDVSDKGEPEEEIGGVFEYEKIKILADIEGLKDTLAKSRNGEETRKLQKEIMDKSINLAQVNVQLQDKAGLLESLEAIKRNSPVHLDELIHFIVQTEHMIEYEMPMTPPKFSESLSELLNQIIQR